MSQLNIPMKLTLAGKAAAVNAAAASIQLQVTHFQFGSGQYNPTNNETALLDPKQAVAIAASSAVPGGAVGQFRAHAVFAGNSNYPIGEIGLWAGDPAVAGSVLVSVYSAAAPASFVAYKTAGVNLTYSADIYFGNDVTPGSITIVVDSGQSQLLTMLAAHEAATDPHGQYTTTAEATAIAQTLIAASNPQLNLGDATLAGTNYTTTLSPSAIPAVFTVRFLAAQPANPTLTVGGTTAPMVDSDGDPITGIAANERRTVQWANGQFTVSESDAKLSNAELLALASSQTGTHPSAGKPTAAPTAASPATELTNTNGEIFRWNGTSWYFVAKVTDVPTGASFGSNGWQKLPSGLIIQWGTSVIPAASNVTVTFSIAFPSVCLVINATPNDSYPVLRSLGVSGGSQTNFVLGHNQAGVASTAMWIAIGY